MKPSFLLLSLLLLPLPATASVVALFDFEGSTDANKATATGIAAGNDLVAGSAFMTDSGFSMESPNGGANSRFARGTAVQQVNGSTGVAFPQAIIDGNFFEFSITTENGFFMTLDSFTLDVGWQGANDGRFGVTSSINGHDYTAREAITTEIAADASSIPNVLQSNSPGSWAKLSLGDWGTGEGTTIDVSGTEFQNITSVTFRIYGFAINDPDPANTANIFRLDNIRVDATVVPEPGRAVLTMLGTFGLVLRRRR